MSKYSDKVERRKIAEAQAAMERTQADEKHAEIVRRRVARRRAKRPDNSLDEQTHPSKWTALQLVSVASTYAERFAASGMVGTADIIRELARRVAAYNDLTRIINQKGTSK